VRGILTEVDGGSHREQLVTASLCPSTISGPSLPKRRECRWRSRHPIACNGELIYSVRNAKIRVTLVWATL
jgi:hypothetical protein